MGDLSNQVHDFEPGILPSGLFWTIPVDGKAIQADLSGRARYHQTSLALEDYGDFLSAISPSPSSKPAHATFGVVWSGNGRKQKIRDTTFGFEGNFVAGDARIDFTVSVDGSGVTYSSDPNGQQTVSAGVGKERNGVFFQ